MLMRNAQGVVYAEFILSFVPLFVLFLGGVQLALIAQARIVVQHAASQAVRAAVVRIDDDPIFYDDGKRKVLSASGKQGSGASGQSGPLQIVQTLTGTKADGGHSSKSASGSARLNAIRNAAYLPLSAVGPLPLQGLATAGPHDLAKATSSTPLVRVLHSLALYGRAASAVTFPRARNGDALRSFEQPWSDTETVYVRVTYLFHCNVPLVRRFACRSLALMHAADRLGPLGRLLAGSRSSNDGVKQRLEELKHAEWPDLQKALVLQVDEQFIALRGEAALPNQGAVYKYPSELCKTKARAPEVSCKGRP